MLNWNYVESCVLVDITELLHTEEFFFTTLLNILFEFSFLYYTNFDSWRLLLVSNLAVQGMLRHLSSYWASNALQQNFCLACFTGVCRCSNNHLFNDERCGNEFYTKCTSLLQNLSSSYIGTIDFEISDHALALLVGAPLLELYDLRAVWTRSWLVFMCIIRYVCYKE